VDDAGIVVLRQDVRVPDDVLDARLDQQVNSQLGLDQQVEDLDPALAVPGRVRVDERDELDRVVLDEARGRGTSD
jgi:hypothetical protein